jgi:hypothetical protein
MWQGFIGQTIASSNKARRRWSSVLLIVCFAVVLMCSRRIANGYMGPRVLTDAQLAAVGDPTLLIRNYVSVTGDKVISSNVTEKVRTTGIDESETTTAEFMVLRIGSRLLIVKARPGHKATSYQGELVSLPGEVKDRLLKGLDADLQAAFLPTMLDASYDYRGGLTALPIVLAIPFLFASWNILKARRRSDDPSCHPFARALARYGPIESIVPQVDAEVASSHTVLGNSVTATKSWFLRRASFGFKAMRISDILWAYMKRTKQRVHGVPVGTIFSLLIWDSYGQSMEITGSEQNVADLLAKFSRAMPWVFIGYDSQVEASFHNDRNAFAATVAARRLEMTRRTGVAGT